MSQNVRVYGGSLAPLLMALFLGGAPGKAVAQDLGAVSGRVVMAGGEGVPDAEVRIPGLGRRTSVNESGEFSLQRLPLGSYLVEATSLRSGFAVQRVQIRSGEEVAIVLELDPLFRLDELVVSAGPLPSRRSETYQPTSALTGWELVRAVRSSLGETLAGELGVSSTYNGPGSSRPIIRGLGGDRVRILEAGVGSGDVSNQGADHAVGIEPTVAGRIEILRGPATLLYGGSAVGGVVNVIDNRIPREPPSAPVTGSLMALGGRVAGERTGALELNGGAGSLAWHLSGLRRKTGDHRIPGFAEHGHEVNGEYGEDDDDVFGILENSAVSTTRGALGLSWIGRAGYLGFALSGLDTDYGVPGHGRHHDHDHEHGHNGEEGRDEEDVTIGLQQRRLDLEGAWRLSSGVLRGIKGRFGYAGYEHTELEGEETGTHFTNEQWEGRIELQHSFRDLLSGSLGFQAGGRSFAAAGEEAFVPPSDAFTAAAFLFQEVERGPVRYQVGARMEGQRMKERPRDLRRSHLGVSLSGGVNWSMTERSTLALTGARAQKLPSLEELFSDGPHAATFAYETGNLNLRKETAHTLDATLRFTGGKVRGEVTGFVNYFDEFIFQGWSGEEKEGLPVLLFEQGDALFSGAEAAVEVSLVHQGRHHLLLEGWGDYVRAELRAGPEPLPRIPPLRAGSRLRYDGGAFRAGTGLTRVARQARVAAFEEETEGYHMLDASMGWRLFTGGVVHDLVLRGSNLTNQEARIHTSFLKALAPLPGREISLMYRVHF